MKKIIFSLVFACLALVGFSQSDTLYTIKNQKIPCKIYEINEFEIKYRMANVVDGPIYVVDKTTVRKYTLSNGFTEMLLQDEMSLQNEHREILGSRQVIKVHPFSFSANHISLAYEKVIKVGMNLDVEAGYINSGITTNNYNLYGNAYWGSSSGVYIKPGMKFFLGQDFSVKGLKYAHPLKGRYFKFDLAISYLSFRNVSAYMYNNTYTQPVMVKTDINTIAYGGFVNYGRQFILGNLFTLDYYIGAGVTGQSNSYSNSSVNTNYGLDARYISNYGGFFRTPGIGLSFTGGFRLGYIIPEKPAKQKSTEFSK